ncbi:MAG: twin-arginine translocation signal domain-containing protein, partial [Pirellulales bacterium]|nr:twin-arginine translocation signal domain-containing protein [Pirellulales bacterium]
MTRRVLNSTIGRSSMTEPTRRDFLGTTAAVAAAA